MTTTLPAIISISTPPLGISQSQETYARAIELRAEAEAVSDGTVKAALLYEVAQLTEAALTDPAQSVQDYLSAYNAGHRLQLPLGALLRVFERKRSHKNLQRLYDAEFRSARTALEKATALVDQGVLATLTAGDLEVARARFERALEQVPELGDAALLLEWNRRLAHDDEGTVAALVRRTESCDDPIHRGVLLLEIASYHEAKGDVGSALEALRKAALGPDGQEMFLAALSRLARVHGHTQVLVEATERMAEVVSFELAEQSAEVELDDELVERLRARTVALWYEAARSRCSSMGDAEGALTCLEKSVRHTPG